MNWEVYERLRLTEEKDHYFTVALNRVPHPSMNSQRVNEKIYRGFVHC